MRSVRSLPALKAHAAILTLGTETKPELKKQYRQHHNHVDCSNQLTIIMKLIAATFALCCLVAGTCCKFTGYCLPHQVIAELFMSTLNFHDVSFNH